MIALDGVKMSKSLGNLVFVSKLVAAGTDPSAIRLGVFSGHYRSDRDWSDEVLAEANDRLARWRRAAVEASADSGAEVGRATAQVIAAIREALSDDLDTPRALAAVDEWANGVLGDSPAQAEQTDTESGQFSGADVATALDALLGVKL